MSDDVPNLRPSVLMGLVQVAVTVGTVVAGIAWMAAKYPDRAEFNGVKEKLYDVDKAASRTADKVEVLNRTVDEFKGDVKIQLNRIENNQSARKPR